MVYLVKTPWWLKKMYNKCTWDMPANEKKIYLTFDDGPHPVATPFVLDELRKYHAKATFFCIGKNVVAQKSIYDRILSEGHAVGNHTFNHLNGWKTENEEYFNNITLASSAISSDLFRPPYGRITASQIKKIQSEEFSMKVIMWSVLSGDFDRKITPEKCLQNVINNSGSGSIIVFHDSEKAFSNLVYALPVVLKFFSEKGFVFENLILK